MKLRYAILLWIGLLVGLVYAFIALKPITQDELEETYGIEIKFDRPENWGREKDKFDVIPEFYRYKAITALALDLEKYNPEIFPQYVKRIYIYEGITIHGLEYGGTYDRNTASIYLVRRQLGDDGRNLGNGATHHEISSLLLLADEKRRGSLQQRWEASNLQSFSYVFEQSSYENLKQGLARQRVTKQDFREGFVSRYGRITFEEDFNEFAQFYVAKSELLRMIARKEPIVKTKLALIEECYHDLGVLKNPDATDYRNLLYWQMHYHGIE